jgi:hypothetical protein
MTFNSTLYELKGVLVKSVIEIKARFFNVVLQEALRKYAGLVT